MFIFLTCDFVTQPDPQGEVASKVVPKGLTQNLCFQDDMNLTEEKKMPLRMQPTENKKKMLINHYKGVTQVF